MKKLNEVDRKNKNSMKKLNEIESVDAFEIMDIEEKLDFGVYGFGCNECKPK